MAHSFPQLFTTSNAQEWYTPNSVIKQISKFISKKRIIYEICPGSGQMVKAFMEDGYKVETNYWTDVNKPLFDQYSGGSDDPVVVTNPPFRYNKSFLGLAIRSPFDFALLVRLEHLGGCAAYKLFKDADIQIIIPEKRINFTRPDGKRGAAPFHSIWVTRGFGLDKDIMYIK